MVVDTCDPSTSPHLFRFLQIAVYFRRRLQQRRSINLISHPNFILFWSSLAVTHPNLHLWRNRWLIHLKISLLRRSFNKMMQFSPLHPSNLRRNGISNAWYSFETSFSHWYGVFFEREEGFASSSLRRDITEEKDEKIVPNLVIIFSQSPLLIVFQFL